MQTTKTYKGKPLEWRKDESFKASGLITEIWQLWAGKTWLGAVRNWLGEKEEWDYVGLHRFTNDKYPTKRRAMNAVERAITKWENK